MYKLTWFSRIIFFRCLPILPQRQIIHGIIRIARHLFLNRQKIRQTLQQTLIIQCGIRFQQYQSLASRMRRFTVNVQLEILIVDQKTSALLVNCEMRTVLLRQQIYIVTVGYLGFHFNHLTAARMLAAHCVHITEMA